jgi:hypothetical protein
MSLAIGRISRWLLCALLWCCIAANCCAQIQDSPRWLVLRTEHRILDQFHDNFGWPDPEIPKGQAVVYVYAEGASYKLLAVGPVTSDAKAYARILNEWKERHGLSGPVLYSQENDCAAALFSVSEAGFGKTSTNLKLPLASIITEIKLEAKTNLGLVINGNLKWPAVLPPPGYLSKRNYGFWDLSKWDEPTDLVIEQKLEPWLLIYFVSVLLFPLIATGACYAFALRFAKDESRSLEQRRKVFRRLVVGGTGGTIALHSVMFVPAIALRTFDPITYLWFDTAFLTIGLFFVPLLLLMPFGSLASLNRTEATLSKLTEEELLKVQLPPSAQEKVTPPTQNLQLKRILPMICIAILGICVLFYPTTKQDPFDQWKFPIAMAIISLSSFAVNGRKEPAKCEADDLPELIAKAERVTSRFNELTNSSITKITILPSKILDRSCSIKGTTLEIAEGAARTWSEDELLYYVLYQSWYKPQNPITSPLYWLLFAFPFAVYALPASIPLPMPYCFLAFLIPLFGAFILREVFIRKSIPLTFDTDLRVVQATGDPESAISALERMDKALQVGLDAGVNKPKPSYTERIERIRAAFPRSTADERTMPL